MPVEVLQANIVAAKRVKGEELFIPKVLPKDRNYLLTVKWGIVRKFASPNRHWIIL